MSCWGWVGLGWVGLVGRSVAVMMWVKKIVGYWLEDTRYLEQLEGDRILRLWSVQSEGGDARMGRQRPKKCFVGVNRRYGPPLCERMLLASDGPEERCAKQVEE